MRRHRAICSLLVLVAACGAGAALPAGAAPTTPAMAEDEVRVMVFSRTKGFRHYSIPFGITAIRDLGRTSGFEVGATEDPKAFNRQTLRRFDAVVFLNTTGDVLNPEQQRALNRYVHHGGGYVGIHSASDTEHDWAFYSRLVGAEFKNHAIEQTGTFVNEAPRNPATAHLAGRFSVFDEFYSFFDNPRPKVRVLLSIDESTYRPDPNTGDLPGATPGTGVMGDHPMSWCHDYIGGRVFYTALGHEAYLYLLEWFRKHLLGGIRYATGQVNANCSPRQA